MASGNDVQSFSLGNVQVSKVVVDVSATSNVSSANGNAHVVAGQVTVNGSAGQRHRSGRGSGLSNLGTALVANRVPLALMFLTLEALLLASGAAWVWARNTPVEQVPDEVLLP